MGNAVTKAGEPDAESANQRTDLQFSRAPDVMRMVTNRLRLEPVAIIVYKTRAALVRIYVAAAPVPITTGA